MDGEADGTVGMSEDCGPGRRRRVHGMLKLYYGLNEEGKAAEEPESLDPCDINGPHFDPELYLNKVRDLCCHVTRIHSLITFTLASALCAGKAAVSVSTWYSYNSLNISICCY